MIAKEQLQSMSDFEINKLLAAMVYGYPEDKDIAKRIHSGAIDFCNTPNDIMPLAFEHKISLMHCYELSGWMAITIKYYDVNKNPLRAITCCLILVLQGEKE